MCEIQIEIQISPPKTQRDFIFANLVEFNRSKIGDSRTVEFALLAKEHGDSIIGGLLGYTLWNGLFISGFWIAEDFRRARIGTRLLKEAESLAVKNGCDLIHLDTFEFQARGFYEKNGFEVFGMIENYPPGYCRYYLQKRLSL